MAKEFSPLIQHLKFIDESGVNLGLTRFFGRGAPGRRVVEAIPGDSGPRYTLIAALGWQGVQASWLLEGAMDRVAFETYIQRVLAPTLRRGDIVVIDNLPPHKGPQARRVIEARGACLEFLPPYSPDFNPIELCWSKVKAELRAAKARTFESLLEALAGSFASVSHSDVAAWFAHCGYAKP
jgi:transposase